MSRHLSRRSFLCALPLGLAAQEKQSALKKPRQLPNAGEFVRITDPTTENTVVRLTSTASASLLPLQRNRFISARQRTLLFASNRSGRFAPYQIDLRTGAIKQLADTPHFNPRSLCFDHQEKLALYLDSETLYEVPLTHGTPKRILDGCSSFSTAPDGSLFLISAGKLSHKDNKGVTRDLASQVADMWPQPNGAGCLFARESSSNDCDLYYTALAADSDKATVLVKGPIRNPFWDADSESILFLRDVPGNEGVILSEIHGKSIHGGDEYVVSPTGQFASFAPNSDASVFVGASRSKAQPNIVILLRSPHRDLTLCEHRASKPSAVSPVFSPDNRRIYFESDRDGNSALYSINVELLVEPVA